MDIAKKNEDIKKKRYSFFYESLVLFYIG